MTSNPTPIDPAAATVKPLVWVKYRGLQSGFNLVPSRALYNVTGGPDQLLGSTVTLESLEAQGYQVKEAA